MANEEKITSNVGTVLPREYEQEIVSVIRSGHHAKKLQELLAAYHENDIAKALPLLDEKERRRLYVVLSDERLSEIFSYADDPEPFIKELSAAKAADIIESMAADDAVDILDELDDDKKNEIIRLMDKDSAEDVQLISAYPDDKIGSLMTTDYICIDKNSTVKEAMKQVVREAADKENITTLFVTENGAFGGAFKLKDLVIARSTTPLSEITVTSFPALYAQDEIAAVLEDVKSYSEPLLPVLDADNRLIGALTSADVIEAVGDEMSEDYAKLAGLPEETDEDESFKKSLVKRLPWLAALFVFDLFIGAYVGVFQAVITGLPFMVCFQQMISGMSGNVGTQSLAVTLRILAEGKPDKKQTRRIVLKELSVGFINGLITGILAAACVFVYCLITKNVPTAEICAYTGAAVGISMLAATIVSSVTGTCIPILFNKMRIDPAVASGPLITTVNDLAAVTVYYSIALALLGYLL